MTMDPEPDPGAQDSQGQTALTRATFDQIVRETVAEYRRQVEAIETTYARWKGNQESAGLTVTPAQEKQNRLDPLSSARAAAENVIKSALAALAVGQQPPSATDLQALGVPPSFNPTPAPAPTPAPPAPATAPPSDQAGPAAGAGTSNTATADPYAAFGNAFAHVFGRKITQDEQNSGAFLAQLRTDLLALLPIARLMTDPALRPLIPKFGNDDLIRLIRTPGGSDIIWILGAERMAQFPKDFLLNEVKPFLLSVGSGDLLWAQIEKLSGAAKPVATGNAEDIPADHAWVVSVGAQAWYHKLRDQGFSPELITLAKLRSDMAAAWQARASDPKFKQLLQYATAYYQQTGWWPTEVELNKFTQNLPGVPNISPDGVTVTPKTAGASDNKAKWVVPTGADGNAIPLPPGYEWRFAADGTPVPYDITPETKDVFSGWYLDPKTNQWSYNPLLGAADYLQSGDQKWSDAIAQFANRTGRLPTLTEARALGALYFTTADASTKARATQFAQVNGYWPTPWELENGPAKDTDANAHGGAAGQPGVGTVPIFVPGIGMVQTQGTIASASGFVFDPMQGIPGSVRPWLREVLNGRITADQVPQDLRAWVDYALAQFHAQLPQQTVDQLQKATQNVPPPAVPGFGNTEPTLPAASPASSTLLIPGPMGTLSVAQGGATPASTQTVSPGAASTGGSTPPAGNPSQTAPGGIPIGPPPPAGTVPAAGGTAPPSTKAQPVNVAPLPEPPVPPPGLVPGPNGTLSVAQPSTPPTASALIQAAPPPTVNGAGTPGAPDLQAELQRGLDFGRQNGNNPEQMAALERALRQSLGLPPPTVNGAP